MSGALLIIAGSVLLLLGVVGVLVTYLLIFKNTEDAERAYAMGSLSELSKKAVFMFLLVVLCGSFSISVFVGGLTLIDEGVKKRDSIEAPIKPIKLQEGILYILPDSNKIKIKQEGKNSVIMPANEVVKEK